MKHIRYAQRRKRKHRHAVVSGIVIVCHQEERQKVFNSTSKEKKDFKAVNECYTGATWKTTADNRHVTLLDKYSNMTRTTFAVVGEKVTVTHNIVLSATTVIPNGAIGRVVSIDHEKEAVVVDITKPLEMPGVRFHRCVYGWGRLQINMLWEVVGCVAMGNYCIGVCIAVLVYLYIDISVCIFI